MIFLQHLKCKPLLRTPKVFAKNTQNTIFLPYFRTLQIISLIVKMK